MTIADVPMPAWTITLHGRGSRVLRDEQRTCTQHLAAVACSDTGTETLVRRVSSPPRTHPADTATPQLVSRPGARNHGQKTGAARRTFSQEPASADASKKKKRKPANHDPESLNVAFRVSHVDDAPRIDGDAVGGCELTTHGIGAGVAPVSFADAERVYHERRY
jgi:hypothetical protein